MLSMLLIGINEKFRLENHFIPIYTLQSNGALSTRSKLKEDQLSIKGQLLEVIGKEKIRLFMTMYHEESNVELAH